jgi:hypothetical protein
MSDNLSRDYIDLLARQSKAITLLVQDEDAFAAFVAVYGGDHRLGRAEAAAGGETFPDARTGEDAEYQAHH